jgi:hypothetical protein
MGYVADNLSLVVAGIEGRSPNIFVHNAVADNNAAITGAGYFSDGVLKGMKVGDLVHVIATGPKYKLYQVASVSGDAATVAAPTAIT